MRLQFLVPAAGLFFSMVGSILLIPVPAVRASPCEITPVPPQAEAGPSDQRLSPLAIAAISARRFGVPYGHDGRVRPTRLDCQTYIEQVMAEALSQRGASFQSTLNRLRYRNGVVRMEERLVYVIPDWLEAPWPVRDVTVEVGGASLRSMTKIIDRARHFGRPALAARGGTFAPQRVDTTFIPRSLAPDLEYPDGSIVVFVQQRRGIVAAHCGFLFQRDGVTLLRHASQTRGAVIQEPLATYLQRAPTHFLGLKVLVPDLTRWEESGTAGS